MNAEDLLAVVTAAVAERRIGIIGAVARNAWAPPRATSDVDFSLAADRDALDAVEQVLQRAGYKCSRRQQVEEGDGERWAHAWGVGERLDRIRSRGKRTP